MIASGGVGVLGDLADGLEAGADAVLAASIFHFGKHTIGEAKFFLAARGLAIRPAFSLPGRYRADETKELWELAYTLELRDDGTYRLESRRRGIAGNGDLTTSGRWSLDAQQLTLVPDAAAPPTTAASTEPSAPDGSSPLTLAVLPNGSLDLAGCCLERDR